MAERAGGNCPPHFGKLRGGKTILSPFFGTKFKKIAIRVNQGYKNKGLL